MPSFENRVDLSSLLDLYERSEPARQAVAHNVGLLKCIRGGLEMAAAHQISFDPREEYGRRPERRLGVAYLADRWTGRFAPASAVRNMARRVLEHLDRARADGIVTYKGMDYDQTGGIATISDALANHARNLAPLGSWAQLRVVWPKLKATAADDVATFFDGVASADDWEHAFIRRLPWFGYLGAASEPELLERQAFFYAYANLWTTTNAYVRAGAMAFAPVLQNTPAERILGLATQWAGGMTPLNTGFLTLGRDDPDDEFQDRSEHAPVVEVFGFLNLERAPFYNKRAERYRTWFNIPSDVDVYDLTSRVGDITREWLAQNPEGVEQLTRLFETLNTQPWSSRVGLETIESPRLERLAGEDQPLDAALFRELDESVSTVNQNSPGVVIEISPPPPE
ncbi:MAG: hypothetical protein H0W08_14945 [Acidobacteria bacterium]|nr:hypothetical protein [Acidobacteriota bacterium]